MSSTAIKLTVRHSLMAIGLLCCLLYLGACASSDQQQVQETTNNFWQAILNEDMETAKQYVTWDSVEYLKFLNSDKLSTQRFETGELQITDGVAEIATVLYGGDKGEMKVPLRTVLIHHEQGWLIDVQKTLGSMVSGTMSTLVDQLNNFMQEGLKGLDKSLTDSIDQLGNQLENGLKDLQKELTKPPVKPSPKPDGQAI